VDADEEFLKQYGPINEYVKANSWVKFRETETSVIEKICKQYKDLNLVFSVGGGAVAHNQGEFYRAQNVIHLKQFGHIIYLIPSANLEESASILAKRIEQDEISKTQRPALTDSKTQYEEMLKILQTRNPLYMEAANGVLYTADRDFQKNNRLLLSLVHALGKSNGKQVIYPQ
jgi:shikimate kinase